MIRFSSTLLSFVLLLFNFQTLSQDTPGIEYGDRFIVFDADITLSDLGSDENHPWVLRKKDDSKYYAGKEIEPVGGDYLEFTGNNMNSGPAKSPLQYTFTCHQTGDYRLAMRMYQPLSDKEHDDKRNDVWVRLEGNYTSACAYTKEVLEQDRKFWGRGVREWGTCYYLESNIGEQKHVKTQVIYHLTKGEQYTFTMSGRAQGTSIDYIILFDPQLDLKANNEDLAKVNPPLYRPGGIVKYAQLVGKIKINKSATFLSKIGESKSLDFEVIPSTAKNKSLTWKSSNEDVVKVNKKGKITGVSNGKATITATSVENNSIQASTLVEVGKYIETFDDFQSIDMSSKVYSGDNGFAWILQAKEASQINGNGAILFNKGITGLQASQIPNGIKSFNVKVKNLWNPKIEREIQLLINGEVVGAIKKTSNETYVFSVDDINVEGNFDLAIKNVSTSEAKSGLVILDDLTWTPYNE
ncbi:Ig-like domain-containing protein [Reichenbachiella versicolor]|uniref:Ig-like domain-containing protein n=1 Tax=Reichenbachiella versicolor TaxID=1821036 RepID=UPI000D6E30F6|nr:Ig-like domain-containing protein [Reichenbachiella versicolor]